MNDYGKYKDNNLVLNYSQLNYSMSIHQKSFSQQLLSPQLQTQQPNLLQLQLHPQQQLQHQAQKLALKSLKSEFPTHESPNKNNNNIYTTNNNVNNNTYINNDNTTNSNTNRTSANNINNNIRENKISEYVTKCLKTYNLCVVDNFFENDKGINVYREVREIEGEQLMEDGQLAGGRKGGRRIRGDKIHWVDLDRTTFIAQLITKIDRVVYKLNGKLPGNVIKSRSKPMVACYPGSGTAYMRHIDNSNQDGRLLTCLYYLNQHWESNKDGGALRIYPQNAHNTIDVEPIFNRLLLFWSDNRTPHEVLPAFKNRYAITVWYFDDYERNIARQRLLGITGSEEERDEEETRTDYQKSGH